MDLQQFKQMPLATKVTMVRNALRSRDYTFFTGGLNLNLIFIRNANDLDSTSFNDLLLIIRGSISKGFTIDEFNITTDPGKVYRLKPINFNGTAITLPQQVVGGFKMGMHKGYEALVQAKPFNVIRDSNRDSHINKAAILTEDELQLLGWFDSIGKGLKSITYNNGQIIKYQ